MISFEVRAQSTNKISEERGTRPNIPSQRSQDGFASGNKNLSKESSFKLAQFVSFDHALLLEREIPSKVPQCSTERVSSVRLSGRRINYVVGLKRFRCGPGVQLVALSHVINASVLSAQLSCRPSRSRWELSHAQCLANRHARVVQFLGGSDR